MSNPTQEYVERAVDRMFGPSGHDLRESLDYDMLLIQALDPNAHLRFVTTSVAAESVDGHAWYVQADLVVTDGDRTTGITEHQATPWEALQAYRIRLQEIQYPERIISRHYGMESHYVWNGAAWRQVTP